MVAVRPGEAQVVVDGERAGVACLRGGAHVKQGKSAIEVRAGEAASLSSARASLATHPLETAPTWTGPTGKLDDPQPLALALGEQPAAPVVAWQPMKGAIGYRIELASDSAFTKVVEAARVGAKEHRFVAKTLREGSYFARVIALDSDGIASRPSSPVPVRVVQVRTPAGGYADVEHATVVAPEGTSLQFSNNAELEIAVDDHVRSDAALEELEASPERGERAPHRNERDLADRNVGPGIQCERAPIVGTHRTTRRASELGVGRQRTTALDWMPRKELVAPRERFAAGCRNEHGIGSGSDGSGRTSEQRSGKDERSSQSTMVHHSPQIGGMRGNLSRAPR